MDTLILYPPWLFTVTHDFRMANLVYMRHFHFAKISDDDEFGFYMASVEAALEHIKSGSVTADMKAHAPKVSF